MPTKSKKSSLATSKKKRSILSRINFSSRKTQFITVILIVGLMGAGWFTYRSFAATEIFTANRSNQRMYCVAGGGCNQAVIEPAKNNIYVIRLATGGKVRATTPGVVLLGSQAKYRICATMISELGDSRVVFAAKDASGSKLFSQQLVPSYQRSYGRYCKPVTGFRGPMTIDIAHQRGQVKISAIQILAGH